MFILQLFPVILIGLKKFATLLPNNWLAETPQTLALMRLGRQAAEMDGFLKSTAIFSEEYTHFQHTYVKITNEPIILQIRGVYLDHI
ncbi:hypothetical protein [Peribacillus frigoritolerans]|uniref:hypothetical protein n=1 Tax=Peribacillus castrilensis TaxID=2897690 RepID=UPI002DCC6E70|nr:hypothetical protein [Peribacillus castrilensis]